MIALSKRTYAIGTAVLIICLALFVLFETVRTKTPTWVTAMVDKGDVSQIVSVSGFIEAKNTAELSFPSSGVVTEVYADEGNTVVAGEVLATLASSQLVAQRNEALAGLRLSEANYDKLIAGADASERSLAQRGIVNAQQALERTIAEENEKVDNARRTLLSSGLSAESPNPNEAATAPTVSGTYTCKQEGTYTLNVYSSNSDSGYSYKLSGLETGISIAATLQPAPLGTCGLYVQFAEDQNYGNSTWNITIPNTRSETYVTNKNAYALAQQQAESAIGAAQDAFALAEEEGASVTADPRSEEVRASQASVNQAQAKIAQIDALLRDRSIVAPFDGVVTDVSILKGETSPQTPVITVLASDAFELKTRVPEIDITKLEVGQSVEAVFDAAPTDIQYGTISYISPLAILIDGVAYFEATIELESMPTWIKSGLNADVDIFVDKKQDVVRVPKRFVTNHEDGTYSVLVPNGAKAVAKKVGLEFSGNDGYVAITGLNVGDTVIAP